jgi:hypothetical protein
MSNKIRVFLLGCLFLFIGIIGYYLQKPALTPVYDVDPPSETGYYTFEDKHPALVPFEDAASRLWGYATSTGQVVIPAQFFKALSFSKYGIADVYNEVSKEWLKIGKTGNVLVTSYFFDNGPDYYVNGLSRFVKAGKIGFINRSGQSVIPAMYDWAGIFRFNYPIAIVAQGCHEVKHACCDTSQEGGRWGIIDMKGKIIIPIAYDDFKFEEKSTEYGQKMVLILLQGEEKYQLFCNRWGKYVLIQIK